MEADVCGEPLDIAERERERVLARKKEANGESQCQPTKG